MTSIPQIIAQNRQPKRRDLYTEFILWTAMPSEEKKKLGLEWQMDFAKHHNVEESTLSRWKRRADFEVRVDAILKMWGADKTPDVVHAIYKTALKGNPLSQKLYLQYFKGFSEKTEVQHTAKVEVGVNDIRFIIDGLPEPERSKFHGYIREIVDYANAVKNARELDETVWDEQPAESVLDEADHDAQDISEQGANELAARYSRSVCADMGDRRSGAASTSAHHRQGAARWW